MKKFLVIAAVAISVFASCKKADPIPEGITLKTDAVVDLKESNFATIEFTSSAAWTAQIVYASEEVTPFAKADVLAGEAGDGKIKLTVESLPQSEIGRAFGVVIMCNQSIAAVSVLQGKVFMAECTSESSEVGVAGGTVDYAILTNCQYTVKKYDQFEEWAPCTVDAVKNTFSFAVSANKDYDPRQAYVKFTVDEIQVPVLDDEGQPTGETEAATYRSYVNQAGVMQQAWRTEFTTDIALASTHTIAKFGDKVYVANALKPNDLFVYNAETGASEGTISVSGICSSSVNSICTDDKGNLIIAFGGAYGTGAANFEVYRINAGSAITAGNATKVIDYANGFYGFGLDNIKVTGDAQTTAAISAVSAGTGPEGSYVVSWQLTNGVCVEFDSYTASAILPTEVNPEWGAIWYSGDIVARHTTENVNSGIIYMGYDAHYNLCYNPSMTGEWTKFWVAGVSGWGENLSGLDVITWGAKKCIVYIANTFFVEWGMASYVGVIDVTDMTKPSKISLSEHYNNGGVTFGSTDAPNERTGDVCAVVENGNLVVYAVDGGNAYITKLVYPAK